MLQHLPSFFNLSNTHTHTVHPIPELTGPPVQDLEPGSTVSQEHSVSPRAEGEMPVWPPSTARHLAVPVVQQPQRVSI